MAGDVHLASERGKSPLWRLLEMTLDRPYSKWLGRFPLLLEYTLLPEPVPHGWTSGWWWARRWFCGPCAHLWPPDYSRDRLWPNDVQRWRWMLECSQYWRPADAMPWHIANRAAFYSHLGFGATL